MMHWVPSWWTVERRIGVVVALLATGCALDPPVLPGDSDELTALPFTSIDNVMHNFALAHDSRDVGLYADCLHESYQFFLDSEDAQMHELTFLNKEADVNATGLLFVDPDLSTIDFDYTQLQGSECWEAGDCLSSVDPSWAEIQFDIDLYLVWSDHTEYVDGRALFSFVEDDDRVWIIQVEDRTGLK